MIITQHTLRERTNFALIIKKKAYNLQLSVRMLLIMPIPYPQKLQLTPSMVTLYLARTSVQQHNFYPSHHGNEPGFIGLGRIRMVEEMVGEVDGRSQKDGC